MRLMAAQEAGTRYPLAFDRSRRRQVSKCPASMAEHRGVRPGIARVAQMSDAAAVRSPRICGVSKTETGNEDCRLDQKSKHRIRPVIALAIFSSPGCDNIMNLNFEKPCHLRKTFGQQSCRRNGQRKLSGVIMRDSSFKKNTEACTFGEILPGKMDHAIAVWRRDFNNAVDRRGGAAGSLSTPSQMRKRTWSSLAIPGRPFASPAAKQPGNPAGVNAVGRFPAWLA
jgi:hypothetical protein